MVAKAVRRSRPLEERKAPKCDLRTQPEKLDEQQARALLQTLHNLKRNMDPLIAAQVYNNHFCPFGRLPEELFLRVFHFLEDDAVTLHCLRITSRVFLRLLHYKLSIWRDEWYIFTQTHCIDRTMHLRHNLLLQFRRLIQRDGRCNNCRRWNATQTSHAYDDCKFRQAFRHQDGAVSLHIYRELYCNACDSAHGVCQFTSTDQKSDDEQERQCLGQQGSVQLCEHVQITWASIMDHINDWRHKQQLEAGGEVAGASWHGCLDTFNIECHESIHDTRCTTSEKPTWPRARLRSHDFDRKSVVLSLEWTPHTRIDALSLTADGRIPAPELRASFQKLRQLGPADILYCAARRDTLPEMAYFSPSSSIKDFVYYKAGEDDNVPLTLPGSLPGSQMTSSLASAATPLWFQPLPLPQQSEWWLHCHQIMSRDPRLGENGQDLHIKPHYINGANNGAGISQQCLAVRYQKVIHVCETMALANPTIKIEPTDHWLHAMDPRTYPYPQGRSVRPLCRDEACNNYYLRPKWEFYNCRFCPWREHFPKYIETMEQAN